MEVVWGQKLGRPECPWGRRWVLDLGLVAFRLHAWYRLDEQEALHDHAWPFVTFVLRGGYTDVAENPLTGERTLDRLRAGSVRYRPAEHRHYVHVAPGGALTLVVSPAGNRPVWFWHRGERWRPSDWFRVHGQQPCD